MIAEIDSSRGPFRLENAFETSKMNLRRGFGSRKLGGVACNAGPFRQRFDGRGSQQ